MASSDLTRQRAHMPAETSRILNARSLPTAHRRLVELLQPGMTVLDVGCGTGVITRDIAEAVAPHGSVLGLDLNSTLLAQARQRHQAVPNLQFVRADLYQVPFTRTFDIVTAARVLQWVAHPQEAVQALRKATKPQGILVVLDYNHEQIQWTPAPPASMQEFYATFLQWRAVAATRGHQMVADGVLTEEQRARAESEYRAWIQTTAEAQTLYLLAVEGSVGSAV